MDCAAQAACPESAEPSLRLTGKDADDQQKDYLYIMISPQQEAIIKTVTQRVKPTFVGVFGSYARGEEDVKSDLDILIDFDMKVDLLELIGMEQELSELLGIKVDLITLRSVNASLRPYIDSDLIRLV